LETLADRIARDGALNELDAVGWVIRLVKRIESIHALGRVHGGISPECVQTSGVPRTSQGLLLEASRIAARPLYHSPERVQGGPTSQADDAWAVGLTLYTLLTGTNPFAASSEGEARRKILGGTLSPLAVYDVGDDDLQRILDDLLTPNAARRAANLGKLRTELEAWHPDPSARDLPALEEQVAASDDDDDDDDDPRTMLRPNDAEALAPVQVVVRLNDDDDDEEEDAQTRMREMPPGVLVPGAAAPPPAKAAPRPAAGANLDDDLPPTARDRPLPAQQPAANARPGMAPVRPAAGARPMPAVAQPIGAHGLPDFSDPVGHESTEIMPAPQIDPHLRAKAAAAMAPVVVDEDEDDDVRTVLREAPPEEEGAAAGAAATRMREILAMGPPKPFQANADAGPRDAGAGRGAATVALSAELVPPFPLNAPDGGAPAGAGADRHMATVALSADQLPPGLAALDLAHDNTAPLQPFPFGQGPGAPGVPPGMAGPGNPAAVAPFGGPLRPSYDSRPSGAQPLAPGMGLQGPAMYQPPASTGKGMLIVVLMALLVITAVGTYLFLRYVPL
jgi:Protein kinase domain